MSTSIRLPQVTRLILLLTLLSLLYGYFSGSNNLNPRKDKNFRRPKFPKPPKQDSAMADQYLKAISNRRSIYAISNESTISVDRIQEILTEAIKHSPTSFNNQAGRAVLLLGEHHVKFWTWATEGVQQTLGEKIFENMKPKLTGFKGGYGTIMFFEDSEALKPFKASYPNMPFDEWSDHAQGMLQVHTWDALELEGLGVSLQHYNFLPGFDEKVRAEWKLPETWTLKAQLVFGKATGGPNDKVQQPVEGKRLLTFGA